ncbi:MAG TPA: NUDIX domain-containing protein [Devosiaceae bacterium]|jgi:8-oxo-dGTP pyrophosphatase MutT (NUDIX family)|nr:NUDIX domain-containing protein [Devosiaceae bacterium]
MVDRGTQVRIAAAVILDREGRMLLVRKRGSAMYMQPGGKIEHGETPAEALSRELREEIALDVAEAVPLGVFSAPAANEPDATVIAEMFAARSNTEPKIGAEIESMLWLDPQRPGTVDLAPLTRDHIVPLARRLAAQPAGALP